MMKLETRAVLAAAYKRDVPSSLLTHSVAVDAEGEPVSVVCGRVKLDSLADAGATSTTAAPTCAVCLRRSLSEKAAAKRTRTKLCTCGHPKSEHGSVGCVHYTGRRGHGEFCTCFCYVAR